MCGTIIGINVGYDLFVSRQRDTGSGSFPELLCEVIIMQLPPGSFSQIVGFVAERMAWMEDGTFTVYME